MIFGKRCTMKKLLITPLVFLGLTSSGLTQPEQLGVFVEPSAANFFGFDARVMAMGGAALANATSGSATNYNPAALARIHRIELSLGLSHQRSRNNTEAPPVAALALGNPVVPTERTINNTRFNSAWAVLPVPTYRGSLVFGVSGVRAKNFDRAFERRTLDSVSAADFRRTFVSERESGGLYAWSVGGAVDMSPNVSLGATLILWTGTDAFASSGSLDSAAGGPPGTFRFADNIEDRYTGFTARVGALIQPNRMLTLGFTVDSPSWFSIDEDKIFRQTDTTGQLVESPQPLFQYDLIHPFAFGAGAKVNIAGLTLAGDLGFTDWSQMEYRNTPDARLQSDSLQQNYRDVLRINLGAEYTIPVTGVSLRAGFLSDPLPFKSSVIQTNRKFFTFGAGFLVDQVLTLDAAVVLGDFGFNNYGNFFYTEKYNLTRVFVTAAWRL